MKIKINDKNISSEMIKTFPTIAQVAAAVVLIKIIMVIMLKGVSERNFIS